MDGGEKNMMSKISKFEIKTGSNSTPLHLGLTLILALPLGKAASKSE